MEIHVVQPGEGLYRIAQHYGVPLAAVLRQNELRDPNRLTPGECIPSRAAAGSIPCGAEIRSPRLRRHRARPCGSSGAIIRFSWDRTGFPPGQTLYLAESGAYPRKIVLGGVRQGTGRKDAASCAAAAGLLSGRIVRL